MGKKSVAYDVDGNITAIYDGDDSPAPAGEQNILGITDQEWETYVGQQGQWRVVKGALIRVPPPTSTQQIATAQAAQCAALNIACANAIVSGFSSSALGDTYSYPSTITDQANQATIAQSADGGMLWCASSGTWSFKQHTQEQAQAVLASFIVWLNKCQSQLISLSGQVNSAKSVSAAQSVSWTNPS
ncbi:hypothetical protein [Burkholderia vietnamiensis]|uniref:hypothetical protein n=1 Tax=Burkholderia vietnamiensis TaxID=60552 RepID=UPI001CF50B2D|nr:hypothetical protein [Burkholderia vietnamiensis]MCA8194467.1 hypothetical protein [Burkholderia vietnamiensis]HDR8991508.1 hypothetical protein [Burkholderia vietnamiensis]HDV6364374.1 hypothetical protein [Burkholderia cepacia]